VQLSKSNQTPVRAADDKLTGVQGNFEAFKTSNEDCHYLVEMPLFVIGNTVRSLRSIKVALGR
jgi:hypothetical protein